MQNHPLVSVPVITYNSSKFIIETLESIKLQTYNNIELIISDDCSTDNTVEICKDWLKRNESRFVRTLLIESNKNTGTSANGNRGEKACQGEWVKLIAGDDILLPSCISDYIDFVSLHPDAKYVFGRVEAFGGSEERNKEITENCVNYSFFKLSAKQQYHSLAMGAWLLAPTCFYNRSVAIKHNIKNDESIKLIEDLPKWMNVTKAGIRMTLMDKVVVRYRLHDGSISTSNTLSVAFLKDGFRIYMAYEARELYKEHKRLAIYKWLVSKCFVEDKRFPYLQLVKTFKIIDTLICGHMLKKKCVSWEKDILLDM